MRAFLKMTFVLGLVLLMAGPAPAQRQRGQRGQRGGGGLAMLLLNKSVQDELKISTDQADKVRETISQVNAKYKEDLSKLRDLSEEERREKGRELRTKISDEVMKSLAEVLKPEQVTRLKQIELQQRGIRAFTSEDVQKQLKLTDEQKEKIKSITEASQKEMRELFRGSGDGNPEEARKKITALRKDALDKALDVLNANQRKEWKAMTGEPFEVKFEMRPRDGKPRQRKPGEGKPERDRKPTT